MKLFRKRLVRGLLTKEELNLIKPYRKELKSKEIDSFSFSSVLKIKLKVILAFLKYGQKGFKIKYKGISNLEGYLDYSFAIKELKTSDYVNLAVHPIPKIKIKRIIGPDRDNLVRVYLEDSLISLGLNSSAWVEFFNKNLDRVKVFHK